VYFEFNCFVRWNSHIVVNHLLPLSKYGKLNLVLVSDKSIQTSVVQTTVETTIRIFSPVWQSFERPLSSVLKTLQHTQKISDIISLDKEVNSFQLLQFKSKRNG